MSDLSETVLKLASLLRTNPEAAASWKIYHAAERTKYDAWFARLPKDEQARLLAYESDLKKEIG